MSVWRKYFMYRLTHHLQSPHVPSWLPTLSGRHRRDFALLEPQSYVGGHCLVHYKNLQPEYQFIVKTAWKQRNGTALQSLPHTNLQNKLLCYEYLKHRKVTENLTTECVMCYNLKFHWDWIHLLEIFTVWKVKISKTKHWI